MEEEGKYLEQQFLKKGFGMTEALNNYGRERISMAEKNFAYDHNYIG